MRHPLFAGLFCILFILIASILSAQVPQTINYQGSLVDDQGDPMTATLSMIFSIYDDSEGGANLWTETHPAVNVVAGGFSVILGETNPIDYSVLAAQRWLQVQVGDEIITPRTKLTSVPYSARVGTIDGSAAGVITGSLIIQAGGKDDIAGNLNVAGKASFGGCTNDGAYSFVAGSNNFTVGDYGSIGGGCYNHIEAASLYNHIGGGRGNSISWGAGDYNTIAGGEYNEAVGWECAIGGGSTNYASGEQATIPGGNWCRAEGDQSFASGDGAEALHDGAFVWASDRSSPFQSTGVNQFLIWAPGGVGIGTNNPNSSSHLTVSAPSSSGKLYAGYFTTGLNSNSSHAVHGEYTGSVADAIGVYGKSTPADYWGIGGHFEGGYKGVSARVDAIGNEWYYGVHSEVYNNAGDITSNNIGVQGLASGFGYQYGVSGVVTGAPSSNNVGVYGRADGDGTRWAGYFNGNVRVTGVFDNSKSSMVIDHPLEPDKMFLVHNSVNAPEMKNIYDGVAELDENGEAVIVLPDYFESLNKDYRYQLTCIGGYAPVYISHEISNNSFSVAGGKQGMKVSWLVTGVRKDAFAKANPTTVELEKSSEELGKYLHPDLFGASKQQSLDHLQSVADKKE